MRVLAAAAALAAGLAAPAAAATGTPVTLPSTRLGLTPVPPLPPLTRLVEERFPGTIATRTAVDVDVAPDGAVRAVRAVQRLELTGLGDYVFAVYAPALDVRPGPGSRSDPGLRRGAIHWQGFSPGRRMLAADARLRPRAAAAGLPLRVSYANGRLVLENVTAVDAPVFGGVASQADLRTTVEAVRAAAATGAVVDGLVVDVRGVRPRRVRVEAPLEVEGTVGGRPVRAVLGGGRPLRLALPAVAGERFTLTVRAFLPGTELAGTPTLERVVVALTRLARVRQYDQFLRNPDPRGPVQTVYRYRSAAVSPVGTPPAPAENGGSSRLGAIVAAALGVAALAGGLAVWARS